MQKKVGIIPGGSSLAVQTSFLQQFAAEHNGSPAIKSTGSTQAGICISEKVASISINEQMASH